jgi:hypothetical protein
MKKFTYIFIKVVCIISLCYSQSDSIKSFNDIKLFQHSFGINFGNNNVDLLGWPFWQEYKENPQNRYYRYDVITDIDVFYKLNIKGFEVGYLLKFQPNTRYFGHQIQSNIILGFGRRYHHNFYWNLTFRSFILSKLSWTETPIVENPICKQITSHTNPCYPLYEGGGDIFFINLEFGYKFFKNKNIILKFIFQFFSTYYWEGRSRASEEGVHPQIGMSYNIYKKLK